MTTPNFSDEEEKPLDPAIENIRRKMVRLLFVSSSAIVLALMAVLATIVYKASRNSAAEKAGTTLAAPVLPLSKQTLTLPKGFVNDGTTVDGNRVWFSGTDETGRRVMIVYDIALGKVVSEITVVAP